MRHMHARVCMNLAIVYLNHFFPNIHTTITNSTRGWPLLGLLTLPTAGEREQVSEENETKMKQAFMHACVCSNESISPLFIVQSSNLSLYFTFALQRGEISETRDRQCACCIQSKHNLYVYTSFFEFILNFSNS